MNHGISTYIGMIGLQCTTAIISIDAHLHTIYSCLSMFGTQSLPTAKHHQYQHHCNAI
jgi:hypothetical protein